MIITSHDAVTARRLGGRDMVCVKLFESQPPLLYGALVNALGVANPDVGTVEQCFDFEAYLGLGGQAHDPNPLTRSADQHDPDPLAIR